MFNPLLLIPKLCIKGRRCFHSRASILSRIFALAQTLALIGGFGNTVTYAADSSDVDPYHSKVEAAGYMHKVASVNQIRLSYWEGPNNGPPLVLLHAQFLDWYSYSRVLPRLAQKFHVYDVDYPGHGKTITPSRYPMSANQIGADISDFIGKNIGEPVFLTGNSSGGLLATWLAAYRPSQVRKVLLEDPPLFSSEYPEIKKTIAEKSFANSYHAVTKVHPGDFLLYWIESSKAFFRNNTGFGTAFFLDQAVKSYKRNNPGQPVELYRLNKMNLTVFMLIRGLSEYDPRFGAAFYDGSWNKGFDHAAALAKIKCPVLLMQANWSVTEEGQLNGAMTEEQANKAISLLKHGTYMRVDASHVINIDKPDLWLDTVENFFRGDERAHFDHPVEP